MILLLKISYVKLGKDYAENWLDIKQKTTGGFILKTTISYLNSFFIIFYKPTNIGLTPHLKQLATFSKSYQPKI